jgi:hypothetical protein
MPSGHMKHNCYCWVQYFKILTIHMPSYGHLSSTEVRGTSKLKLFKALVKINITLAHK